MIWRLPHPVRGLVVAFVTFLALCALIGFGVGAPELVVVLAASGAVFWLVATRTSEDAPRS